MAIFYLSLWHNRIPSVDIPLWVKVNHWALKIVSNFWLLQTVLQYPMQNTQFFELKVSHSLDRGPRVEACHQYFCFWFFKVHQDHSPYGCATLQSYQQCNRIPLSPHSLQQLLAVLSICAILTRVSCYLTVVLVCI